MIRLLVLITAFMSASRCLAQNTSTAVNTPTQNATVIVKNSTQTEKPQPVVKAMRPPIDMPESTADSDERFPTDWMNPNNVMQYNIDDDPMGQRISSIEDQTKAHRALNHKGVFSQVGKRKA